MFSNFSLPNYMIIVLHLLFSSHFFLFKNSTFYIDFDKYLVPLWICELKIVLSGCIELNFGPKINFSQNFSICDCNYNSIPAHNVSKISLLNACNSFYVPYIICLSQTYLDSSNLLQHPNLEVQGHMLI